MQDAHQTPESHRQHQVQGDGNAGGEIKGINIRTEGGGVHWGVELGG